MVHVQRSDKLVRQLQTDTGCSLYRYLTTVHHGIDILTANCMLLLDFAATGLTKDFEMSILGHMLGGCIGSIAVN